MESIVGYDYVATQAPADGYTVAAALLTDLTRLPAGAPKPAVDRLYGAAVQVLQKPDVRSHIEKLQMVVLSIGPEPASRRVLREARLFADVARRIGMVPQ